MGIYNFYQNLRNFFIREKERSKRIEGSKSLEIQIEQNVESADYEIQIIYTPPELVRAAHKIMQQRKQKQKEAEEKKEKQQIYKHL